MGARTGVLPPPSKHARKYSYKIHLSNTPIFTTAERALSLTRLGGKESARGGGKRGEENGERSEPKVGGEVGGGEGRR